MQNSSEVGDLLRKLIKLFVTSLFIPAGGGGNGERGPFLLKILYVYSRLSFGRGDYFKSCMNISLFENE